jgi:hypothetical protein
MLISRHYRDRRGSQSHQQQRCDQGRLAADAVAIMSEDRGAHRTRDEADRINGERLERPDPGVGMREEQFCKDEPGDCRGRSRTTRSRSRRWRRSQPAAIEADVRPHSTEQDCYRILPSGSLRGFLRRLPKADMCRNRTKLAALPSGSIRRRPRVKFCPPRIGGAATAQCRRGFTKSARAEAGSAPAESKERGKNTDMHVQV